MERRRDRVIIANQVGVSVQHEEGLAQRRQCVDQRTAGSEQRRAVVDVLGLKTETPSVPDRFDDLLAAIADAEYDPADALACQQPKLMVCERLAGHLDQRLWDFFRYRAQPHRQPAG
jgi:hypothetical protein